MSLVVECTNNYVFSEVRDMLIELYFNRADFNNTVVVLGYNQPNIKYEYVKLKYPTCKIIVFNLELLFDGYSWVNEHTINWFKKADEVWDYNIDNITFLKKCGIKAKYQEMKYVNCLKRLPPVNKNAPIDVLFYGTLSTRRTKFLTKWMSNTAFKCQTIISNGSTKNDLLFLLKNSKIILNLHTYDVFRQEQVRIFYPVINGRCVVSENSDDNHFSDSIIIDNYDTLPKTLNMLLSTGKWYDVANSASEKYKNLSYNS